MEKSQRDFKGVWIPKEIWLSEKLSLMEKVLFVEIHSLDNERGCFASNRYFAEFFGISERQIQNYLASLKERGFITVTVRDGFDRTIRTAGKYARVSDERIRQLHQARTDIAAKFSVDKRRRG
jgi:DNA-binding transcriptional ArsR family regulator